MTTSSQNEQLKTHEKKRGKVCVKPGYTFALKSGSFPIREIRQVELNGKAYHKCSLILTCLSKKTKKENTERAQDRIAKKKQIYKIADHKERKQQLKVLMEEDMKTADIFNTISSEFILFIEVGSIFSNFLDTSIPKLWIQPPLSHYRGEVEHMITINIRNENSFAPRTHSNTSHSVAGIHSRSIQQKDIYVFAYFDDLDDFLIIPGCLIDEESFLDNIPY